MLSTPGPDCLRLHSSTPCLPGLQAHTPHTCPVTENASTLLLDSCGTGVLREHGNAPDWAEGLYQLSKWNSIVWPGHTPPPLGQLLATLFKKINTLRAAWVSTHLISHPNTLSSQASLSLVRSNSNLTHPTPNISSIFLFRPNSPGHVPTHEY